MISTSLVQHVEALLDQQLQMADELKQILADENAALIQREYEQLQHITQLKDQKSSTIEVLGEQLRQRLAAAGLSLSQQSLDTIEAGAPKETATRLHQLRQELEPALQDCQGQNLVNGQITAVNRQSAEAALAILRGQFAPGNLTYGAAGKPVSEQTSTPISKA